MNRSLLCDLRRPSFRDGIRFERAAGASVSRRRSTAILAIHNALPEVLVLTERERFTFAVSRGLDLVAVELRMIVCESQSTRNRDVRLPLIRDQFVHERIESVRECDAGNLDCLLPIEFLRPARKQ